MMIESSVNVFIFSSVVIILYKLQGLLLATSMVALLTIFKTTLGLFYPFLNSIDLRKSILINIFICILLMGVMFYCIKMGATEISLILLSCCQSVENISYNLKSMNDIDFYKGSKKITSRKTAYNNMGILIGSSMVAIFSEYYTELQILNFLNYCVIISILLLIISFNFLKNYKI